LPSYRRYIKYPCRPIVEIKAYQLKNILAVFQDEYVTLTRKYSHAKRLIFSLKEAGNVLTEQLLSRDQEYFNHLAKLRYRDQEYFNHLAKLR
jgi:membrane carboxypeptidase/penicillin-binding protein